MKMFDWKIAYQFGTIEAVDMREALKKALAQFLEPSNPPYIGDEVERLDIFVKARKSQ